MKPSLQFRLSQHLTLTPQLQQSIRLLQLSTVELNQEIERRVLHQDALDLLVELDRGQLQQSDRLLQLRRERQVLREAELKRGLHQGGRGPRYMRKFSPRYTRRTLSL